MKSMLKNKKGFTLVELLAVIVILALIMAIAIVSMSGVIDSARLNTTKNNALYCIDAVRSNLILNNRLDEGTYYFSTSILDKGGKEFAFGGNYRYPESFDTTTIPGQLIGGGIIKATTAATACSNDAAIKGSFVVIKKDDDGQYKYTLCMPTDSTDGYFVYGTEDTISNAEERTDVVKTTSVAID